MGVTKSCYENLDGHQHKYRPTRRQFGLLRRLGIPPDLQPILKKRELWKSLGTRDPREAREKVLPVLMQWRGEFAELRKRREPTAADLQGAVWSRYQSAGRTRARLPTAVTIEKAKQKILDDIEVGRIPWSEDADPRAQGLVFLDYMVVRDASKYDRERRAIYLRDLKRQLAIGETALISVYADDVIERERLLIERGSPAYRDLCQRLQRAQIQALERAAERDAGDWSGAPTDPIVTPPDLTMGNKFALPGESIMELSIVSGLRTRDRSAPTPGTGIGKL